MLGSSSSAQVAGATTAIDDALMVMDSVDLHEIADPAALLATLSVLQRRVEAQLLRTVAVFDSRQAWRTDGAASGAAWLRANLRLTPGAASATIRTARRLSDLPVMSQALRAGEISTAHVEVVTQAMARTPQREASIASAEPTFCTAAKKLDPAQLAKVVARWSHTVDPLSAVEAEQTMHAQRFLSVSRTLDGAVMINGLLAPEPGAVVLTALGALSTDDYRQGRRSVGGSGDNRTPGQRRADALVELTRRYLDSGSAPEIAGVRPHLQVTVPLSSLAAPGGEAGHDPGELEGVGPISAEASRRIACDASLTAIGVDATGMPLSYGRTVRVVPPALRRFLVVRDRGCVAPWCDRPASWAQAHHLVHWSRGGPTDAENLALFCSRDHHMLHEGGFSVRGSPSRGLTFYRPDGTEIEVPGPSP